MESRAFTGGIRALVSPRLERRGFLAAFTERTGGASAPPYASLNLGTETGDDPGAVQENRRRLAGVLGLVSFATARQVHGTAVAHVRGTGEDLGEADALTTSLPSTGLAVMTADCVPLALASEAEARVAAVHIGWRGLAAGLVQAAVRLFEAPTQVVAGIGPAIGPCHYEVGSEVVEAVRRGADGIVSVTRGNARPRLDLAETVERLLRRMSVAEVDRADPCTACQASRFFSHRRDGVTGRQALVAVRL